MIDLYSWPTPNGVKLHITVEELGIPYTLHAVNIGNSEPAACNDPKPKVLFRTFGGSSLDFELLCWIEEPAQRGNILDSLNCAVYKGFIEHGIEIPYAKHDLYIKEMPGKGSDDGDEV